MEYIAGRKYLIKEKCREKYGKWVVAKETRKNVKYLPCRPISDKCKILWVKSECIEREGTKKGIELISYQLNGKLYDELFGVEDLP